MALSSRERRRRHGQGKDMKAKSRHFEVSDKVLVMTPSMTGKLDDQWMGPYIIAEKMNDVTYKVHTPDRRKKSRLFHVKFWHTEPVAIMSVRFCEEDQVHESQDPDVLPFEPKEAGTPTIGDQLTNSQREELQQLLQEHRAVFDTSPGHTEVVEHRIVTGESRPVYHPPYRIPQAWQSKVQEEVQAMAEAGIIVPSSSPWTSPLVPVRKKDGRLRLCVIRTTGA